MWVETTQYFLLKLMKASYNCNKKWKKIAAKAVKPIALIILFFVLNNNFI